MFDCLHFASDLASAEAVKESLLIVRALRAHPYENPFPLSLSVGRHTRHGCATMVLRVVALSILLFLCTATSCFEQAAVAVAAGSGEDPENTRRDAFSLVARLASSRGLRPSFPNNPAQGWAECLAASALVLCGKELDREFQFMLSEAIAAPLSRRGLRGFSPRADSLRRELLDSLRARFGATNVRECNWLEERDPRRSGCPPLANGNNAQRPNVP